MKTPKIYDTHEYIAQGTGRLGNIFLLDRRCFGRFPNEAVYHRLYFDKFDENCLEYIIERSNIKNYNNIVSSGRIHHVYVDDYSKYEHCKIIVEARFIHEESGEKMWLPITYLPTFYYKFEEGEWIDTPTSLIYKQFCEENENWEWVSEHTPKPIYVEIKKPKRKHKSSKK